MADLEGFDELLGALENTALNMGQRRKLIVKALREGSKPVQEESTNRIPVDTGKAKASISTTVIEQSSTGAEAQIGPRRFYPKFAELGTIHQSATPWLGPSFDNKQDQAVDIISDVLSNGIEESFGG
jgi:HK97 gp10 family phage protein